MGLQEPIANIWPVGTGGFSLHGAAAGHTDATATSGSSSDGAELPLLPPAPHVDYHIDGHGRPYSDQVNVQWSCGDVTSNGGGFACESTTVLPTTLLFCFTLQLCTNK